MTTLTSDNGRKSIRLKFFLQRHLTAEQKQNLSAAKMVTFLAMESIGEKGEIDLSTAREIEEVANGYTQFFNNDVLVAKITPCFENGKGALAQGLLNGVGYGTTELHVLRPQKEIDARFLYYLTASPIFRRWGEAEMTGAAGQKRVTEEFVRNYRVALPPLEEQRAIAEMLDAETARLDELIAEKERLLALLAEKRRALITRAVTRGLDAAAPVRESGLQWLGDIPEHWDIPPVYARYKVQLGKMLDEKQIRGTHPACYLRNIDVQWGNINTKDLPVMDFDEDDRKAFSLKYGDILICEGGEIGRAAIWREAIDNCYYQKALHRLRPATENDFPDFFVFAMRAMVDTGVFLALSTASTIHHLPAEKLRVIRYPAPPLEEQRAIVDYITAESRKLDDLRDVTKSTVGLLRERRAALIAAAVTGQIDVKQERQKPARQ
jgi:type I restriction enzyme S subunit